MKNGKSKKTVTQPEGISTIEISEKARMSDELFLKQAKEVLKSVSFPTQPQVLMEVRQEIIKPEPVFKNIAEILSKDLALTAKVMKIVNSPFYSTTHEINSLPHALSMLGLENINGVVLASSLRDAMHSPSMPLKEFNLFYNHSLQVGRISQLISRTIFPGESDQHGIAYMAGLFHDCGIPILAKRYPDYFEKILPLFKENSSLELAEEAVYMTNHSIVGSLIAKTWKMPLRVRQAIFFHHREDIFGLNNGELVELLCIVMLAEKIVAAINQNDNELNIYQFIVNEDCFPRILANLNITAENLAWLEEKARELDTVTL